MARFKILEELAGQGGFGKISLAVDSELDRQVAFKTLDPLFKHIEDTDVERFKREAKTLAALSHSNIPSIYDVEFNPEQKEFKIIYQWIEGITLRKYLDQHGLLSLEDAHKYFKYICSALNHAHEKSVIHRDIKPSNLIITASRESCYVVDFGVALTTKDIERLTNGSNAVGTPGYMSPEQEQNQELTAASDIFSLGIVLYECLSGVKPSILDFKPVSAINEAIPTSIDRLIADCLTPPTQRIQTAEEFYQRFSSALRPSTNLGKTFAEGSIADIIALLSSLNHSTFTSISPGHKILLTNKLKTLIAADDNKLRNPTAAYLHAMLKVSANSDEANFRFIVRNALVYGFDMRYGPNGIWKGNPNLRSELGKLAIELNHNKHELFSEELLDFLTTQKLAEIEEWAIGDLKTIVQNLLANDQCNERIASNLDLPYHTILERIYKK